MEKANGLRVLNQIKVCPSPGCVDEATVPLTFFDAIWISSHPVERIFFYPLPQPYSYSTTHFTNSIVPSLTSSLSLTLRHFYPLAGKVIKLSPNSNYDFAIHYKHGDSVSFTIAESLSDFQALSSNHPHPVNDVYTLVPSLDKSSDDSKPLLSLQATFFPNSGITIGIALNHVAGDGPSFMHFFKSWALSCSSSGSVPLLQPPPLLDNSLVNDPHGCYSIFLQNLLSPSADKTSCPGPPAPAVSASAVCATFFLGSDHIQRLKDSFYKKYSKQSKTPSSFAVTCAYAWVCFVKAQGYSTQQRAYFCFTVDCRERLKPPLPANFFGNCIGPGFVEEDVEKLMGEDGVLVASEAIVRTIEECRHDVLRDVEGWMKKFGAWIASGRLLTTAGSPKFGVYGVDFGWGRPSKVELVSIAKTGAMSLAEMKHEQGGIELGFVMSKPIMDEFSSVFCKGLDVLISS